MPTDTKPANSKPGIDMRKTKLKASEAALLAGELNKPSWESRNEGIHERVSFEDAIWGFDLAGGSFYKTPLRVTAVKSDSRAEKAGIRPGDMLLRINDIDTSTLTIQEAHKIIVDSGIHLRIAVTAPEDEEDSYHCWEDPLESGYDSDEERRKEEEKAKKRQVHAKVSSYWSLQWPWVSKRRVIYRESNCFMVPSKFESNHRDKFPLETNFGPKVLDDIVLNSASAEKGQKLQEEMRKGDAFSNGTKLEDTKLNNEDNKVNAPSDSGSENITNKVDADKITKPSILEENGSEHKTENIDTDHNQATTGPSENVLDTFEVNKEDNDLLDSVETTKVPTENVTSDPDITSESELSELQEGSEETIIENGIENNADHDNSEEITSQDDEILDEMLGQSTEVAKDDEETIFNDILNESDAQNSEVVDENQR